MKLEQHPKEIYCLRIILLLMLVLTLSAQTYPANNLNIELNTIPRNDSNSLRARGVLDQSTFHRIYEQQPIAKVLYELSTFFEFNSLILDLENRKISHHFTHCNLQQCLEELHSTGRIRMHYGTNMAIFSRSESRFQSFDNKPSEMNLQWLNKDQPRFNMSTYNASLFLVLERIIKENKLLLRLSNQLEAKISLHLKSGIPFETLFYVMKYYKLKIIEKDKLKIVVPRAKVIN